MARSKIFGFDELAAKLTTLSDPGETLAVMRSTVANSLNESKKVAQQLIPVGIDPHRTYKGRLVAPGFAKRSIKVVVRADKKRMRVSGVLGVRAEAFYAVQFVELGTVNMPARPWLRPALMANSDKSVRMIGEGMKDWIRSVAAKHLAGTRRYTGGAERAKQLLEGIGE